MNADKSESFIQRDKQKNHNPRISENYIRDFKVNSILRVYE